MISKDRIVAMLLELGQAIGVYLSEDRVEIYYQKLRGFHPEPLSRAIESIIDSWENPNRFPPVGVIISKTRQFSGEGTPNAIGRYVRPAPPKPETEERSRRAYEALKRYVDMDETEYWDLVLRMAQKRPGDSAGEALQAASQN